MKKNGVAVLEAIDSILKRIGVQPVLENEDFVIDQEVSDGDYLRFSTAKSDTVRLTFSISEIDFEVAIDRISEALTWSIEQFYEQEEKITAIVCQLFVSSCSVEKWGNARTQVSFKKDNVLVKKINDVNGLWFFESKSIVYYEPVFGDKFNSLGDRPET